MPKIKKTIYFLIILIFIISPVYFSFSSATFYQIPQSEVDELNQLYQATGGEYWYNNENWTNLSATFLKENIPYGLTLGNLEITSLNESATFYSANIQEIDLSRRIVSETLRKGNNLIGEIPDLKLSKLEKLDLSANKISGEIPEFDLPNLLILWLWKNNLKGEIPEFNMPNLEDIDLSSNQLTGTIPNFNFSKLKRLGLSFNQLTGTIPNFNLPSLVELVLQNNQLTGEVTDFDFLPNLQSLFLGGNELTGKIPDFDSLNLIFLDLARNQLTGEIPNFKFVYLRFLHLYNNELTGEIPEFNSQFLFALYFENNKLSGNIPELKQMVSGGSLYLSGNLYSFEALEVNSSKSFDYIYAPQDTTLPITKNDNKLKVTVDGSSNTYTWFLNENEVSSGISNSYRPSQTGIYHCEVTNSLLPDLTLSSSTISVIVSGISTEDQDRFYNYLYTFPPYPQPASSGNVKIPIYWRLGNPVSTGNIKIYNTMGVEIIQENKITIQGLSNIHGEIIWDISGVDAGIYFLEIHHGTSTRIVKIMLE